MMRVGQAATSGWFGRMCDRFGNRPVLIMGQLIVATGPLFFVLARPDFVPPLAGAFLAWSAFAALNIAIPNLATKLGPQDKAGHVGTYFAWGGLAFALGNLIGGQFLDRRRREDVSIGRERLS